MAASLPPNHWPDRGLKGYASPTILVIREANVKERANEIRASLTDIAGFEVVMEAQDMRAVIGGHIRETILPTLSTLDCGNLRKRRIRPVA
jgi:hypothetical protein